MVVTISRGVLVVADAHILDEGTTGSLGAVSYLTQAREILRALTKMIALNSGFYALSTDIVTYKAAISANNLFYLFLNF